MEENKVEYQVEYQLYVKNDKGKWQSWGERGSDIDSKIETVEAMNRGANGARRYEGRIEEIVTTTSIVWEG